MKAYSILSGILCAAALAGCSNATRGQIADSIKFNQEAESLVAWKSSDSHPEHLFEKWNETLTNSSNPTEFKNEICSELLNIDAESLTLFEIEFKEEANQAIIADCADALNKKIEDYYMKQREELPVIVEMSGTVPTKNNFKFPEKTLIRDYSNGYYVVNGDVGPKELVLTFDDGPNNIYTPMILRALKDVNAKVMFFHSGKAVRANPETLKQVAADGHMIGSHSITHRCLGTRVNCARSNGRLLTFNEAVAEIKGGHQAVYDVLGWVDPIFRFPFGESSPELKSFLRNSSTGEFYWSIDSNDWKAQSNENLLKTTLAQIDQRGRGVVLFHDIQRKTAEIMPTFLREVHKRGYTLVVLQASDKSARYNSKLVKKNLP